MTHPRRFRFGVQTSTASSGEEWAELARKAEDLGYATMFLPDHFGASYIVVQRDAMEAMAPVVARLTGN
jgi:alkanesulfonate monooxygenase SsuD/methylene tetrahydromethanopterin reductase-like flavin-dependent oxidoreductase (luciferase family)